MRTIVLLCVLMTACASHDVRCDGRLRPINLTGPRSALAGAAAGASGSGKTDSGNTGGTP